MTDQTYPAFPPGLWRRIAVYPAADAVTAGLEDDIHHFHLRLRHEAGVVTAIDTAELRVPYTTCPGAGAFLREQSLGRALTDLAALDPKQHCTHLFDLAIAAAYLAGEQAPVIFDMRVGDRVAGRTRATLARNGREVLRWDLGGTAIEAPAPWSGLDLRQLSRWQAQLSPDDAFYARLLRMAAMVSNARQFPPAERAADLGTGRLGACFTHQMPRSLEAVKSPTGRRDFSQGQHEPLGDFGLSWFEIERALG